MNAFIRAQRWVFRMLGVLGLTVAFVRPATAVTEFDGDVIAVSTSKPTYSVTEPIWVMATYTNVGNESQLLLGSESGGVKRITDVGLCVVPLGASKETPCMSTGSQVVRSFRVDPGSRNGSVGPHAALVVAVQKIPAGVLRSGIYTAELVFRILRVDATTGKVLAELLSSAPQTVIEVKQ